MPADFWSQAVRPRKGRVTSAVSSKKACLKSRRRDHLPGRDRYHEPGNPGRSCACCRTEIHALGGVQELQVDVGHRRNNIDLNILVRRRQVLGPVLPPNVNYRDCPLASRAEDFLRWHHFLVSFRGNGKSSRRFLRGPAALDGLRLAALCANWRMCNALWCFHVVIGLMIPDHRWTAAKAIEHRPDRPL